MTRKPIPKKSETRTEATFDLIHTDVCGPMQTSTPSGNRYFLTMIDDHSKYTVVYLLKHKSEVSSKIKDYVKYVQTKFQITPKTIRSDRGGEYTAENLKTFLTNEGIQTEFTNPYTPQQNGVAERKNRYLVEMARSMLVDSGLPNKYWGEAIITANHMQNRLPVTGRDNTPYQTWTGRKPNLSHIRRFGCTAFAAIPAEKRRKLDDKANKLIFVGYETGTKGYRLLDIVTDKITISKDVIFIEGDPHSHQTIVAQAPTSVVTSVDNFTELSLEETFTSPEPVKLQNEVNEPDDEDEPAELIEPVHSEPQNVPSAQVQAQQEPRRSQRKNKGKPPDRLIENTNKVTEGLVEPKTYEEALSSPEAEQWTAKQPGMQNSNV